MDIVEQVNNGTYKNITTSGHIYISTHELFDSNEQNNIKKFEQLCNIFLKSYYVSIHFNSEEVDVICIRKNTIFCTKEYFKYIINVIKKYPQISKLDLMPHEDINDDLYELLSSSPNIKKYSFNHCEQEYFDFDWTKTYVRNISINENKGLIGSHVNIFVKWFKQNPQIYSLHNHNRKTDALIYDYLMINSYHSLMAIKNTSDDEKCKINTLLTIKRINMYEIIKTMLLISNHQHKFKKYLPKYITRMILKCLYDIDYLKLHHKLF